MSTYNYYYKTKSYNYGSTYSKYTGDYKNATSAYDYKYVKPEEEKRVCESKYDDYYGAYNNCKGWENGAMSI